MAVTSLVLGIVSVAIAWIPGCGWITIAPAIVGLILGIIDVVQKNKTKEPKGMSIAGLICSTIALAFDFLYFFAAIFSELN